jgi:hypothetical protein
MRPERDLTMIKKEILPEESIQSFYNQDRAYGEYWLLLAKVELSKFSKINLEEVTNKK